MSILRNVKGWLLIPSYCLKQFGILNIIPFLVLAAVVFLAIPRLLMKETIEFDLPPSDAYVQAEERARSYFAPADFLMITVEGKNLYASDTLLAVERLTRRAQRLAGVAAVLSFVTMKDIQVTADELLFKPLFNTEDPERSAFSLKRQFEEKTFLRRLFLSKDEKVFNIYVFPKRDAENKELVSTVLKMISDDNGNQIHLYGERVLQYFINQYELRELIVLGLAAVLLILLVEVYITRSLLPGLLLWISSLLPAFWVLGMFPLFRLDLGVTTLFIPIIVLALSTSYGIHLFRYYSIEKNLNMQHTLDKVCPTILSASFTTIFGFASLLFSPIRVIRIPGMMLMLGIFLATLATLFFLPVLLARVKINRSRSKAGGLMEDEPYLALPVFRFSPLILAGFLSFLAVGVAFIHPDYRLGVLKKSTTISKELAYFYEHNGGLDELEVVIDTGREFGLVDTTLFKKIKEVSRDLERNPYVSQVISFTDFVEWGNGQLSGSGSPMEPKTDEIIGETLELLSASGTGVGIDTLVDPNYAKTRMLVRFGIRDVSAGEVARVSRSLTENIEKGIREKLPGMTFGVFGYSLRNERKLHYLLRGLFSGMMQFLPMLFVFLFLLYRSVKWVLVSMIPTVSGVIFCFGILGWLRIPLSLTAAFSLAVVMGVSVDDVIYFILFFKRQSTTKDFSQAMNNTLHKAGVAAIQTTLIIVVGISVLFFSVFTTIAQSAIVVSLTLSFCTMVTLLVVPTLVGRIVRREGR